MQEYVEERTIAISVKAAKLSGKVLAAACKKVFAEIAKQQEAAKRPKGRQSVRKLMNHHGGKNAMKYVGAPKDFDRIANYDREYGCLPLDCECYMLGKCWTGAYCRYFREAVLPLDPVLTASICEDGPAPDTRLCAVCGRPFLPEGRQAYCSDACKAEGNRRRSRERMRKKRLKNG